jgi:ABC-type branched-subunit amino acid transport system permease subunit
VNIVLYKILIFVFTSMIVGLAGAVFYSNVGSERIVPEQIEILQMSLVIAYAVVGGMESLIAAAAGAFISAGVFGSSGWMARPAPWTNWPTSAGMANGSMRSSFSTTRRKPNRSSR